MADDLKQRLRMFAVEPVLGGVIEEAADRIEELEFSWAGCSQQLKDACADLSEVERELSEAKDQIEYAILRDDTWKKITEKLEHQLADMTSDRDSWSEQADERTKDAVMFIQERDALQADNARLREALQWIAAQKASGAIQVKAIEALAATPEQSLARIRNQVLEKCAHIADDDTIYSYDSGETGENYAKAIRAMKEQE